MAARDPAPGAGSCAAVTVALAAGLAAMTARASGGDGADRADALLSRVAPLAQADARAYEEVLKSTGSARREALGRAAEVPLEVAEAAAEAGALAADLAVGGNPNLRGEAVSAALLAAAAARAAAALVEMNTAAEPDGRVERAATLAAAAADSARRALDAAGLGGGRAGKFI